jgi:putative glutathione S-transferase
VPAVVDMVTGLVVTNDYPQIALDLSTEWTAHHAAERAEMDALMADIDRDVNNGVHRAGFAAGQAAYEEAYDALFARLDLLSELLSGRRYLMGASITEADVRLFTALARFDAVYHGHFKCKRNKLTELPTLWAYARDPFSHRGFGETVDFGQIERRTTARITRSTRPGGAQGPGPGRVDGAARSRDAVTPESGLPLGGRPDSPGSTP